MQDIEPFPVVNLYSSYKGGIKGDGSYQNFKGVLFSNGEIKTENFKRDDLESRLFSIGDGDDSKITLMGSYYTINDDLLKPINGGELPFIRPFRKYEYLEYGIEGLDLPENFWTKDGSNSYISHYARKLYAQSRFEEAYKYALYSISTFQTPNYSPLS